MSRARRTAAAAAAGLVLLTGCAAGGSQPAAAPDGSRLAGTALYVDPDSNPARQVRALEQAGQPQQAEELAGRIGRHPVARWFTGQEPDPFPAAEQLSTAAAARGEAAVVTVYDLPERDCGQYSAGGAPDDEAYLRYVGALAAGLGDRASVVVLEPDAVAHSLEGCGQLRPERTHLLLSQAVDVLRRQAGTRVYLDAGNASWIEDLPALAGALRASGVERADGFALNVSNFSTTEASTAYGARLSELLGGAHFVVDTSRNGAGPPEAGAGVHQWCNPDGRRLGAEPTTDPGLPRVDALLWVKTPGDSDGACTPDAPAAGTWWPEHARELMLRP